MDLWYSKNWRKIYATVWPNNSSRIYVKWRNSEKLRQRWNKLIIEFFGSLAILVKARGTVSGFKRLVPKNFFWSSWSFNLKFDFSWLGNPPWVRWSSLPELYQERVKKTANSYDIFSEHKRYGGNELDISALLTYTVADHWLKDEGTLLFLLPQNHLQNDSSSGFRQLQIDNKYLQPLFVEDLKDLSIFLGSLIIQWYSA